MATFEIVKDGKKLRDVVWDGSCMVLGREAGAAIRLDDPIVSRRHARVYGKDGAMWLEDLGTTNGTFVNGRREYKRPLADGDRIELGAHVVRYRQGVMESIPDTALVEEELPLVTGELVLDDGPSGGEEREAELITLEARRFDYEALSRSFEPLEAAGREDASGSTTRHIAPAELARLRREKAALLEPHLVQHQVTPVRVHALRHAANVLGASDRCQLRVPEVGADEAATLERRGDGGYAVRKLGLLGRVKVNGARVQKAPLGDGDLLEVGGAVFTYREGA